MKVSGEEQDQDQDYEQEDAAHLSCLQPLISTGLQPGVMAACASSRFNGFGLWDER